MQSDIIFFQSTALGGTDDEPGLVELLMLHSQLAGAEHLFEQLKVVVPNPALAAWLKDRISAKQGICANYDFVVLLGPVLEKMYLANNPEAVLFDFSQAKYLIYEFLCTTRLTAEDSDEVNHYLYPNGKLKLDRAFQLATQLQTIFHEYLYLRTDDLIHKQPGKFKAWQLLIWEHLCQAMGSQKTYLDIYRYFSQIDLSQVSLKLPRQLFIFGLTSVYPSQLRLIKKLASQIRVYWYYQPCSYEYYGDLLSPQTRAKLEQRLLKKPDLSLEDLYLTDGNPLIANLGQQSREFIELLRAHEIEVYDFAVAKPEAKSELTILQQLQEDVRNLCYRVAPHYRLTTAQHFYAEPYAFSQEKTGPIFDLASDEVSLKVNVCHNRMREVQVLFNEIAATLTKDASCQYSDILVVAPDIDDYTPYLQAVFANEVVYDQNHEPQKIAINITGNRQLANYKVIETLALFLNAPYRLTVNYFIDLLMQAEIQANLAIDSNDISLIKQWLADNNTYWGYDQADYASLGYQNFAAHSFKQFLANLVVGACMSQQVFHESQQLPLYQAAKQLPIAAYDNLESSQFELLNQLIKILDLLQLVRATIYDEEGNWRQFSLSQARELIERLQQALFNDEQSYLRISELVASLPLGEQNMLIELPILNLLISEFMAEVKPRINFNGAITCASLIYMRNLPHRYIYVLGLNFSEFPRSYQPNQLSSLANDWYIADRNYTIEDKQAMLDIFLAAKRRLVLSYIGRSETDNRNLKPSPVVSLILTTVAQSFTDFADEISVLNQQYNFRNIVEYHSLHPFYKNQQLNYSLIWNELQQLTSDKHYDRRWDFSQPSPIKLSQEQYQIYATPRIKQLVDIFCYSNSGLFRVLGLSRFNDQIELMDNEFIGVTNRELAKKLWQFFEEFADFAPAEQLIELAWARGLIGYQTIGAVQFQRYFAFYQNYCRSRGMQQVLLELNFTLTSSEGCNHHLAIREFVYREGHQIILLDKFELIKDKPLSNELFDLNYTLLIHGLIVTTLVAAGATIDGQEQTEPLQVVIRHLNWSGETYDFPLQLTLDATTMLNTLFRYYLRSLTYPVLIHQQAILAYAKTFADERFKYEVNLVEQRAQTKAEQVFNSEWNNSGRRRLVEDPIWSHLIDDYFGYMAAINGVNDIVQIGKLLASLTRAEANE